MELANKIYDGLLNNYDNDLKEINGVRNLSYVDNAISVIKIGAKENDISDFDEFLEQYVQEPSNE